MYTPSWHFFYHKPVLIKKKCPLLANNSKLCACISYFTNIEWEQGCFVLENEKRCKNNNNKIKRSFQQTNFYFKPPLSFDLLLVAKMCRSRQKDEQILEFYDRNEDRSYNKQNIKILCIAYDLHFAIIKV